MITWLVLLFMVILVTFVAKIANEEGQERARASKEALAYLVALGHRDKKYRPVAVALLVDRRGQTLLVQSAKNLSDWGAPQGGIDKGEDAVQALYREVEEETGIKPGLLATPQFLGCETLDAESSRKDKRGFTRGKEYFFFRVGVNGVSPAVTPQKGELADARWVSRKEVRAVLATTRQEKKEMLLKYLLE